MRIAWGCYTIEVNKNIPKNEVSWVTYLNIKGDPVFVITSKSSREYYYLYEILKDESLVKLGRDRSPAELEKKFHIKERVKNKT